MQYQIFETRKFFTGSLTGLTVEHKYLSFDNKNSAKIVSDNRVGAVGGGPGFGSEYVVVGTRVEKVANG